MKNSPLTESSIVRRLMNSIGSGAIATKTAPAKDVKYTLRVEDGVMHINNVSGKPEGVIYTLMTENRDGSTALMTRFVSLAPFQAFADEIEGAKVLAAWEKN